VGEKVKNGGKKVKNGGEKKLIHCGFLIQKALIKTEMPCSRSLASFRLIQLTTFCARIMQLGLNHSLCCAACAWMVFIKIELPVGA
jgi:hypothetical protein